MPTVIFGPEGCGKRLYPCPPDDLTPAGLPGGGPVWAKASGNPYSPVLNRAHNYVASTTLREPLIWEDSTLLEGDAADAVAELKKQGGEDLGILGSGRLIHSLLRRDLIDEFVLLITPIVLGTGLRLFPDGHKLRLRLIESLVSTTGVMFGRYEAE